MLTPSGKALTHAKNFSGKVFVSLDLKRRFTPSHESPSGSSKAGNRRNKAQSYRTICPRSACGSTSISHSLPRNPSRRTPVGSVAVTSAKRYSLSVENFLSVNRRITTAFIGAPTTRAANDSGRTTPKRTRKSTPWLVSTISAGSSCRGSSSAPGSHGRGPRKTTSSDKYIVSRPGSTVNACATD